MTHTSIHSVAHFLSDHFPPLEHPQYQSVLEIIGFLTVIAMIAGALGAGLLLVFHAL
jgi:hypothetical protein